MCGSADRLARIRAESPDHLAGGGWLYPFLRLYFWLVRW
jgi:hypothetical protein